jgi:hypothetical protein
MLIKAGANVNQRVKRNGILISPLEVALTEQYPLTELFATKGQESQSVRGAALDLYHLQRMLDSTTAQLGLSLHNARVVPGKDVPPHIWQDELIDTLVKAGAIVTQGLLDRVHEFLNGANPLHSR